MKTTVITFLMMFFCLIQSINAQNAPVNTIGNYIMSGSTISVPITTANFTNIGSCNLKLTYNPGIVTALNVTIGSGLGGNLSTNLTVPGEISLGWYAYPAKTLTDNTVIFTINFQKLNSGTSALSFYDNGYSCIFYNGNWSPLNDLPDTTYYHNGSITVLPVNAPHIIAPLITAVSGDTVSVAVKVSAFNSIGSLYLTLNYNQTVLNYLSFYNNSSFPALSVNSSTSGSLVINGTSSAYNGVNYPDSTILLTLKFIYHGGSSGLNWIDNGSSCKYTSPQGGIIYNDSPQSSYYIDGSVNPALIISGSSSVCTNTSTSYSIPDVALASYQWNVTNGVLISGNNTNTVNVIWNNNSMNGTISVTESYSNNVYTVSKQVTLYSTPTNPAVIGNATVSCNTNETYNTMASSVQYFWSVVGGSIQNGQGSNAILVNWDSCSFYNSGTVTLIVNNLSPAGCSSTSSFNVILSHPVRTLYGQVTYDNSVNTPLNNVYIQLVDSSNNVVASTTTTTHIDQSIPGNQVQISGYYEFFNINNGNYVLKASTTIPWKGVTATDALLVKLHSAGIVALSDLPYLAADVNLSNCINATDGLVIELRCVGIKNSFDAGDWVFGNTNVNINGLTEHNFKALVIGDVNKSYLPSNDNKSLNNIYLQKEGVVKINNNEEFEFPVKVNDFFNPAAITMDLFYNSSLIEITGLTSKLSGLEYNISNNKILIAWSAIYSVSLKPNDILFTLKVKAKAAIDSSLSLLSYGSILDFADGNGKSIQAIQLKVNSIETGDGYINFSVNPNPFKNNAKIYYNLPEPGNVKIILFNAMGQKTTVLQDAYKTTADYNINVNTSDLQPGLYFCEMIFNGDPLKFHKIIKLQKIN